MTNNHWYFCLILLIIMTIHYGIGALRGFDEGISAAGELNRQSSERHQVETIKNNNKLYDITEQLLMCRIKHISMELVIGQDQETIEMLKQSNQMLGYLLNTAISDEMGMHE